MGLLDRLKRDPGFYLRSTKKFALAGLLYASSLFYSGCRDEPVGPEPVYPSSAVWDLPVQVYNGGMGGRDGVLEGSVVVENLGGFQGDLRVWSDESGFEKIMGVDGLSSLEAVIRDTLRFPEGELPMDVLYNVGVLSSGGVLFEDSRVVQVVDPGKVDALLGWSGGESVFSKGFWNTGVYEFDVSSFSLDTVKVLSVRLGDKEWVLEPDKVSFDTTLSKTFSVDNPVQVNGYMKNVDSRGFVTEKEFDGVFVDVLPVRSVEVMMKKYLSQEPNLGGSVSFRNEGVGWDTTLVADGNGLVQGVLPEGVYDVLVDGRGYKRGGSGGSRLSRLWLPGEGFGLEEQFFVPGEGHGFVVSGPFLGSDGSTEYHPTWQINPGLSYLSSPLRRTLQGSYTDFFDVFVEGFKLYKDFVSVVESVDSEDFLFLMAGQAHSTGLVVPRVGVPLYVVVNLGNHDYPLDWNVSRQASNPDLPLPDGGLNPPGVVSPLYDHRRFTEVAFDVYWERHVLPIVNEELVGGNPFDFRVKKGYADEIKEYLDSWNVIADGDDLLYIASSGLGAREHARVRHEVVQQNPYRLSLYIRTSNIIVPWMDPWFHGPNVRYIAGEDTFHGAVRQGYPPACSVRDEYRWGVDTPCNTLPESVLHDFDRDFRRVAYGFGPAAQVQGVQVWLLPEEKTKELIQKYGVHDGAE